jgi:hypothetical protein
MIGGMLPLDQSLPASAGGASAAAVDALLTVLRPLARVAVDHGVRFSQFEELVKRAMVEAAMSATASQPGAPAVPISRLSVVTGIHRKEVKRLAEATDLAAVRAEQTPASELFTRWVTDPAWLDEGGRPRVLPRRAADDRPSFERLSRAVTTDVHPRTLLDELQRLDLVAIDERTDEIALRRDAFVPAGQVADLLAFLGGNVGDHLAAARENIAAALRTPPGGAASPAPFVEQALFGDGLSAQTVAEAGERARAYWGELLRNLAPALQRMEDDDRASGRPVDHRLRIGLYCYSEPLSTPETDAPPRPGAPT